MAGIHSRELTLIDQGDQDMLIDKKITVAVAGESHMTELELRQDHNKDSKFLSDIQDEALAKYQRLRSFHTHLHFKKQRKLDQKFGKVTRVRETQSLRLNSANQGAFHSAK